jgi:hypothetical protein
MIPWMKQLSDSNPTQTHYGSLVAGKHFGAVTEPSDHADIAIWYACLYDSVDGMSVQFVRPMSYTLSGGKMAR